MACCAIRKRWNGWVRPIYDSGSSLGYDKVASQIRSEREVGCKPFKNHHAEQIKLVSDFSWIDFGRLSDVKDLIIETLTADGAEEYMDAGRIEAITESVERRIRNLSELAMKQTAYPTASTEDDVEEDIATRYLRVDIVKPNIKVQISRFADSETADIFLSPSAVCEHGGRRK